MAEAQQERVMCVGTRGIGSDTLLAEQPGGMPELECKLYRSAIGVRGFILVHMDTDMDIYRP